jgi:hypothetical protein
MERFESWAAYNAVCEPGRQSRAGMAELKDLVRQDQVQDEEDINNLENYSSCPEEAAPTPVRSIT